MRDEIFELLYYGDDRAQKIAGVFKKHEIRFDELSIFNIIAFVDAGFEEEGYGFAKRKAAKSAAHQLSTDLFRAVDNMIGELEKINREARRLDLWYKVNELTMFSLNTFVQRLSKIRRDNQTAKMYFNEKIRKTKPGRIKSIGYDDFFSVIDDASFNLVDKGKLPSLAKDLDFLLSAGLRNRPIGTWRVRCKQYFLRNADRPKPWEVRVCSWLEGAIDEVQAEWQEEIDQERQREDELRWAEAEEEAAHYQRTKVNSPEH